MFITARVVLRGEKINEKNTKNNTANTAKSINVILHTHTYIYIFKTAGGRWGVWVAVAYLSQFSYSLTAAGGGGSGWRNNNNIIFITPM